MFSGVKWGRVNSWESNRKRTPPPLKHIIERKSTHLRVSCGALKEPKNHARVQIHLSPHPTLCGGHRFACGVGLWTWTCAPGMPNIMWIGWGISEPQGENDMALTWRIPLYTVCTNMRHCPFISSSTISSHVFLGLHLCLASSTSKVTIILTTKILIQIHTVILHTNKLINIKSITFPPLCRRWKPLTNHFVRLLSTQKISSKCVHTHQHISERDLPSSMIKKKPKLQNFWRAT